MADPRTVAAAVHGDGLGVLLLAAPDLVIRAHTAGRLPHDWGGEYGTSDVPERWRWVVRAVGLAVLAVGLWFGGGALGLPGGAA